jgi:outer membrane protein W
VGVSYQFSIPIGETYKYTPPVSWRGIGLDVATFVRRDLAVGLAFGWNVFFENTTSTITYKGTEITGNQDRSLNVWPTLVNARWFPKISSNRDIQPYIGAHIGGYIIERYIAIGLTAASETHFHFGLAPEIGVFFQNPVGAVFLNARYNMAFASGGVPFQQFLSISLGYAWER